MPYLFTLLILAIPGFLLSPSRLELMDLPEFLTPAYMLLAGQGSAIYNVQDLAVAQRAAFPWMKAQSVVLYAPPPGLVWLLPLGIIPSVAAGPLWWAILLLATVAALFLIKKVFNLSPRVFLWSGLLLAASGPQWEAIRHGQPASLLLLGMMGAIWALSAKRDKLAAFCLAIFFLKPHLVATFLAYLLGAGHARVISYLVLIGVACTALSFALIGSAGWVNYFDLFAYSMSNTEWMAPELCPTVRGQLLRLLPESRQLATMAGVAATVVALAISFLLGRRARRYANQDWSQPLLVAVPLGLVSALHCHNYDLLLLVPALMLCTTFGWNRRTAITAACALPLLMPFYNKIHYDYVLPGGTINPIFLSLSALVACLWMLNTQKAKASSEDAAQERA